MHIEHAAIYVNDLEAARGFLEKYLDGCCSELYHNPRTGFSSYFLSFGQGARVEIMNAPDMQDEPKQLKRTGYAHLSFSLGTKEKVDELTERLRQDGYEVVSGPRITGDGYYESCVVAFEGNQIELTV